MQGPRYFNDQIKWNLRFFTSRMSSRPQVTQNKTIILIFCFDDRSQDILITSCKNSSSFPLPISVADFVFSTLLCISCLLYHPEHLQLQYFCLPPDACPNLSDGSLTSSLSLTVSVFIEAEVLVITQFICKLVLSTFVPQVWHHC